jgi:hypothetical protein
MRFAFSVALLCAACGTPHPRDVGNKKNPRSEFGESGGGPTHDRTDELRKPKAPAAAAAKPRIVARASSYAIALDAERVYFGDSEDGGLFAAPRAGGEKQLLTRRAPTRDGLADAAGTIVWIATPGDTILRAATKDASRPESVRSGGIFAQLVMDGDEVFFTEALSTGGALTRARGTTTTRLALFEGAPRGLAIDAQSAFVVTPSRILRVPRATEKVARTSPWIVESEILAQGSAFAGIAVDERSVFTTTAGEGSRVVVALAKVGGATAGVRGIVARGVADGPLAVDRGEVLFMDASRPALRASSVASGATRTIAEDPVLARVTAIAADEHDIFLATGDGESAQIVALPR